MARKKPDTKQLALIPVPELAELAAEFAMVARRPDGAITSEGVRWAVESIVIRRQASRELLAVPAGLDEAQRHKYELRAIAKWRAAALSLEASCRLLAVDGYSHVEQDDNATTAIIDAFAGIAARIPQGQPAPTAPAEYRTQDDAPSASIIDEMTDDVTDDASAAPDAEILFVGCRQRH